MTQVAALWSILESNYARVEARYHDIDLMRCSLRKVLNLTYAWLVDLMGGSDEWDEHYKPIFDPPRNAETGEVIEVHPDFDYVDMPQIAGLVVHQQDRVASVV